MTAFLGGLLGLLGRDADPVSSREFILLARCVEEIWGEGGDGHARVARRRGGAAAVRGDRRAAARDVLPEEGARRPRPRAQQPPRLARHVRLPGRRPARHRRAPRRRAQARRSSPIFSIAHLSDPERLFVVATLLSRVRSWLRSQPGSTSLRALIYIDEIFGFFPPSGEPPTKKPLLSLLKQARAFGVGTVLATQNPVDLDYKGLSNCGCWWVGTLQTERDRRRLADGLTDAAGLTDVDALLNQTKKRTFLLHDVHRKGPEIFETRWAMSYLRGPMTRDELTKLKKAAPPAPLLRRCHRRRIGRRRGGRRRRSRTPEARGPRGPAHAPVRVARPLARPPRGRPRDAVPLGEGGGPLQERQGDVGRDHLDEALPARRGDAARGRPGRRPRPRGEGAPRRGPPRRSRTATSPPGSAPRG